LADSVGPLIRQFAQFGAVGTVGFLVDASVLLLLLHATHAGFYLGRLISFLCAATVTWCLNRTITFRSRAASRGISAEWLRFVAVSCLGGIVNFGVYSALLLSFASFAAAPVAAVAAGSLSGMVVNFGLSRSYAFRGNPA
jgi:putative flippase GtrA